MNAVVHAGGGTASTGMDAASGRVQVWVEDKGAGIEISRLPHATLGIGYSTAGTLGHGVKLILQTVDRMWLLTGTTGTTVVLEQDRVKSVPGWLHWGADR
jgi:anti-sigma regulatory factor (Ser/Thr protein kinase)